MAIGFPFNSHVEYDELDTPVFDRAIDSGPLKNLIAKLFSNGVLPNPSTNLQVVTGEGGMSVIVKAGFCIINGGLKLEEEDKTLVVQAADTTYPRIDTVVMRWNDNDEVRACDLYVVEGTPAAIPVRPTLTRSESIYELGLADIFITANSTSIDSFRITDTRLDNNRCGYISSISEFDTTTLYNQIQADLENFQEEEQADFLAWYEEMRDQLSEDAAGHLQLEIDEVNGRYNGLTQDISEWVVLNQLPAQGRDKTLYLITGEEEAHYVGEPSENESIIDDDMISTDKTFSSNKVQSLINTRVEAETGKGLSSNDYTNAEKQKLSHAITSVKSINGISVEGEGNILIPAGSQVEINPQLEGPEPYLTSLEVDGVKVRVGGGSGGGAEIDDTSASSTTVYSSSKVETIANGKLDASLATVSGGAENLFDIANSKANWKPSTSSGATYSDGSTVNGTYTTNLIPANSSSKFKINFAVAPSYYRTFFYNSSQVFKGGVNNLVQDTDGYFYIDLSGASVSSYAYICLVFTTNDASMFNNLVIGDYATFGDAKTIINDLYLSDDNVIMVKDRLGILNDDILYGKKWAVAGDSFTEGGWSSGQAPLIPDGKFVGMKAVYPYLIGNRHNMTIQNLFKAGRTLAHPSDDTFTNTFADIYQTVAADADYLTIYLGINDSHHRPDAWGSDGEDTTGEITLGTINDNTTGTFYGAWNVILTWLITNRPNLKIGIIATNGAETDDYRVATIAIAQKYGIPYIDLNGDARTPCMIRSTNANMASAIKTLRTTNWRISSSNNHPNADCHVYESTFIEEFLRTL